LVLCIKNLNIKTNINHSLKQKMIYSVESILKIEKERSYTFRLDAESIAFFNTLVSQIGIPIQKSSIKKVDNGVNWETVRHTNKKSVSSMTSNAKQKTTHELVRKDNKTILSENIEEIRMILNKITNKNYTETLAAMVTRLTAFNRYYQNGLVDEPMLLTFCGTIFSIATQNQFYSQLYASLMSDLALQFEFLKTIINDYVTNLLDKLLDVGDYISEDHYDAFCKMNEENDRKKSLSEFFVNLNKRQIVSDEMHIMFCVSILKKIMEFVIQPNKTYQVDILAELLSILYDKDKLSKTSFTFVQSIDEDENGEEMKFNKCIKNFSKAKTADFKSLTKKTIFKFMDMQGV